MTLTDYLSGVLSNFNDSRVIENVTAFVASDQARTMTATEVNISCGALME